MARPRDLSSDPHTVLGLSEDASPEDVARAYRELAKRLHPDRAGSASAPQMAEVNAAYELLRDGLASAQRDRLRSGAARPGPPPPPSGPRNEPGGWLDPAIRRLLGTELLAALEPEEEILATADAATWDSHDVRLAVTDRRLLWLRDDAISDRVRHQRFSRIRDVEARRPRRLRRTAELRVTTDQGRRLGFGELAPDTAERLVALVRARLNPARGAVPRR